MGYLKIIVGVAMLLVAVKATSQDRQEASMGTYKQQFGSQELRLVMVDGLDTCVWKTIMVDTVSGAERLLLCDTFPKNLGWKHYEEVGEAPQKMYTIGGAIHKGNNLYVVYSKMGTLMLYRYGLGVNGVEVAQKTIRGYFSLPSHGDLICIAHFAEVDEELYLSVCSGMSLFGKITTNLYKVDAGTLNLEEMKFDTSTAVACAIYISDETKRWMKAESISKRNELSEHSIESLNMLSQHVDQPYYFKRLDTDWRKRDQQIAQLRSWGFQLLSFWSYGDSNEKSAEILAVQEQHIRQVLEFCGHKLAPDFKLLSFINHTTSMDVLNNVVYFFYRDEECIKYIRYDKYYAIWLT